MIANLSIAGVHAKHQTPLWHATVVYARILDRGSCGVSAYHQRSDHLCSIGVAFSTVSNLISCGAVTKHHTTSSYANFLYVGT